MLIDLKQLDVDPGHDIADRSQYDQKSGQRLRRVVTSKGMTTDDDDASVADKR